MTIPNGRHGLTDAAFVAKVRAEFPWVAITDVQCIQLSRAIDILSDLVGGYKNIPEKWVVLLGTCISEGVNPVTIAEKIALFNRRTP